MSGLMIFTAHPRLYWGEYGANFDRAWLSIGSTADTGYLRVGDWKIDTTGVLGRWTDAHGVTKTWAFPGWATIPTSYSLADGRRWHLLLDRKGVVQGKSVLVRVSPGGRRSLKKKKK